VASGREEAFRWENGVMTSLGVLATGNSSWASAISADESVIIGGAYIGDGEHAFRWKNGVMSDLGVLPGGYFGSTAYDVSGDGSILVGYSRNNSVYSAMIWDQVHGMRDLKSVLVNDYKLNLNGWALKYAEGISDDGRTIAGYGINPKGQTEGWIATIPEPASAVIMILGASLIASRRKK
jgi:probable HAF family extracellular repeat protein